MATVTLNGVDYAIPGSIADVTETVRVAASKDAWLPATLGAAPVQIRAASASVVK